MTRTADAPVTRRLTILNVRGLHARASAKFVREAEKFEAVALVEKDGERVDARSIMGLLTLGAGQGTQISIEARGADAAALVEALAALVADRFGEAR